MQQNGDEMRNFLRKGLRILAIVSIAVIMMLTNYANLGAVKKTYAKAPEESLKDIYAEYFDIGVALPVWYAPNGSVIGNEGYLDTILGHFNSMTFENEMKPDFLLTGDLGPDPENARVSFERAIPGLEFAKKHGLKVRGHVLIWHDQTPEAFFHENYDVKAPLADRDLMLKRMENYIRTVIEWTEENYPGIVYAWDVANEVMQDDKPSNLAPGLPCGMRESRWRDTIGDDFVEYAFEYARRYAPEGVKLFYNDYDEYHPRKRDAIIEMLRPIAEAGNIDGMGMQSHFDREYVIDDHIEAVKKYSSELGLEIQVTELDIQMEEDKVQANLEETEKRQGEYYYELMRKLVVAKNEGVNLTSVTIWGLADGLSWRPTAIPLLLRGQAPEELEKKPAYYGFIEAKADGEAEFALAREIQKAEGINTDHCTLSSQKAFRQAVDQAKKLLETGTAADWVQAVEKAVKALQAAASNLASITDTATKQALGLEIQRGKAVDISKYTDATAKAFREALDKAESVWGNSDAGQNESLMVLNALKDAYSKLAERHVAADRVRLRQTKLSMKVKGTKKLIAEVLPVNASNKKTSWRSSNPSVAAVDQNGKVTAKRAGTSKITVTAQDGKKTAVCTVTVKKPVVKLNKKSLTLKVKRSAAIKVRKSAPTGEKIKSARSSKKRIVSVSVKKGRLTVKGKKAGRAVITITTTRGGRAKVTVKVKK